MKIKSLIKHNLMRAAMTLLVMLPWAANAQTRECNPITTYPWTENFDSYTGTTSGSTNNLPECWNYINTCTHNSYKGYPVVFGANYTSGHSGHNFLYFESYYQYDPKPQYAILPKMSGLAGKHITLWAMGNLANSTCTFKIGTMSDPADASTFGAFAEQELSDYSLGLGWQEYAFTVPTGTTNTYLAILMEPAPSSNQNNKWISIDDIAVFDDFSQTGDNEYTIFTAAGWGLFCDAIAGGESFSGKTVKLGADITITRMACDENHKFNGTFNGQGHTLTVNYGSADNPIDTEFVAPFVCSGGNPVFLNLTIAGHIYSTYTCNNPEPHSAHTGTGGLIGHLYGTVTIEHCMSNVEITVTGEQYASGFVGLCEHTVNFNDCMSSAVIHSAGGNNSGFVAWSRASGWNINFTGCVFNGKLLQINGQGNSNGGFIGWTGSNKTVTITNCLYAPAALAEGEAYASYNSATFARGWQEHCSETNSYYTTAFGAAQGTQAHSITAGNFVTAANAGTATAYATSGITSYGTGIKYNNVLYAGSGESVALTISNTVPASFNFTGYSVTDGASLNGSGNNYTLTMPNAEVDVVITANCTIPPVSYIDENGVAQTCTYYYPLEGTETTLGTAGQETWYVAQPGTLNYSSTITLLGNTHIILCDGAAMNIGTSDSPVSGDGFYCNGVYDLSVYTQSGNTGALAIYSSQCPFVVNNLTLAGGNVNTTSYYDANCNNLTVCRSTLGISASSGSAIYALGDVTFSYVTATTNGSITCANTNFAVDHSQLTVNATNMTAIQTSGGNVTLSYVTADITSSNYQGFYCSSFAVDNSQLTVTAYYEAINALGGVITLGCTAATDFIKATRTDGYINSSYSGTVKIADGQTLYAGTNAYTGTLTDAERQAIGGQKLTNVAPPTYDYIDLDGTGATHTAVVINADNMPTALSGWYIVQGTVNYTNTINLGGDTHIILADNAVMNVTVGGNHGIRSTSGNNYSFFVYGQTGQSGELNVTSNSYACYIYGGDITIAGGKVTASGSTGIFALYNNNGGNVTIKNATVTATASYAAIRSINGGITINNSNVTAMGTARYGIYAEYSGNILLNGGKITATGNNYGIYAENGNITLGWTNPTDYIYVNKYYAGGTLSIADNTTFIDEDGHTYSGTIAQADGAYAIDGKTLYPYIEGCVPYIDENGQRQLCTEYNVLNGTETTLGAAGQETWYVVQGTLNYSHGIQLLGNTHIILCDGAAMNIGTSDNPVSGEPYQENVGFYGDENNLSLYAQSGNTGTLTIYSNRMSFLCQCLTLAGGNVNTTTITTSPVIACNNNLTVRRSALEIHTNGPAAQANDVALSNVTANINSSNNVGFSCSNFAVDNSQLTVNTRAEAIVANNGIITLSNVTANLNSSNGFGLVCSNFTVDNSQLTVTAPNPAIQASVITLGCTAATDFIKATNTSSLNYSYYGTVKIADGQTLYDGANAYTGTLTDAERQTIGGRKLTNVAPPTYDYIGLDGTGATHTATVIDADYMPTSLSGWYIVQGTVSYTNTIDLAGDTHIILADNAVMNVTVTGSNYGIRSVSGNNYSLFVYGQTGQSGELNVTSDRFACYIYGGDITIAGGKVTASGTTGIFVQYYNNNGGNVTIKNATVTATGTSYNGILSEYGGNITIDNSNVTATSTGSNVILAQKGGITIDNSNVTATATNNGTVIYAGNGNITIANGTVTASGRIGIFTENGSVTINGGQVTATGNNYGIHAESSSDNITLGWTNPTDYIYANKYYAGGTLSIAEGKAFIDENNTFYSGTVAMVSGVYAINGKTLYPNCVVRKQVVGYEEGNGGWVFIASPVAGSIAPSEVHNLIATTEEDYDLYRFNQSDANGNEWQNWKATTTENHPDFTSLVNGQGYLYATKETRTLMFAGEYTAATGSVEVPLDYDATAQLKGWNLVGNPFTVSATLTQPYYRMNAEGSALKTETETTAVAAMEGVFVQATGNNQTVSFTPQTRGGEKAAIAQANIMVGGDNGAVIDNAIIRFDGGQTLEKFSFREGSTKLYIPQDGKDYAIATSNGQGEMPLNFKAEENGTYTISVNPEGVEMNYLHLIDNMTGTDVDLLFTQNVIAGEDPQSPAPSYTFTAKTTDYESRFRLVFVANGEDGSATGSEAFAFFSNGNWIIANDGQATLQVIDINGRILSSESISGSVSKAIDATAGVYMIRLINGENVKTQKIVVR